VLQETLAALRTVLELTRSPDLMLLVSIIGNMTTRQLFGVRSLFILQRGRLTLESRQSPLSLTLTSASGASIIARSSKRAAPAIGLTGACLLVE
jgi:hypothetical protein